MLDYRFSTYMFAFLLSKWSSPSLFPMSLTYRVLRKQPLQKHVHWIAGSCFDGSMIGRRKEKRSYQFWDQYSCSIDLRGHSAKMYSWTIDSHSMIHLVSPQLKITSRLLTVVFLLLRLLPKLAGFLQTPPRNFAILFTLMLICSDARLSIDQFSDLFNIY